MKKKLVLHASVLAGICRNFRLMEWFDLFLVGPRVRNGSGSVPTMLLITLKRVVHPHDCSVSHCTLLRMDIRSVHCRDSGPVCLQSREACLYAGVDWLSSCVSHRVARGHS